MKIDSRLLDMAKSLDDIKSDVDNSNLVKELYEQYLYIQEQDKEAAKIRSEYAWMMSDCQTKVRRLIKEMGLEDVTIRIDGINKPIKLTPDVSTDYKIPEAKETEFFKFLRAAGQGKVIKVGKESVHWQTKKALLGSWDDEDHPLPEWIEVETRDIVKGMPVTIPSKKRTKKI